MPQPFRPHGTATKHFLGSDEQLPGPPSAPGNCSSDPKSLLCGSFRRTIRKPLRSMFGVVPERIRPSYEALNLGSVHYTVVWEREGSLRGLMSARRSDARERRAYGREDDRRGVRPRLRRRGGDIGAYVDWEHPVESPVLRRPEPVSVTFEVDPELVVAFDSGRHSNHILRASACGAGSILSLRMLWTNAGLPMSSAVCRCCEFQRIAPSHRPTSMIGGL